MVWGGEFGRTPMVEIRNPRDAEQRAAATIIRWPTACSSPAAASRAAQVIGKTDELCMNIVEDKVHVHDLQATLLHCLGLEHTRLTYPPHGPRFPPDGRGGQRGEEDAGVIRNAPFAAQGRRLRHFPGSREVWNTA